MVLDPPEFGETFWQWPAGLLVVSWGLVVVLLVVVVVLVVLVAEVVRVVLVVMAVVVLFHWLQNCESCYDQQRGDIMRTMMVTLKQTVNPKPFCNQTRTLQTPNPKFALTNPQSETEAKAGRTKDLGLDRRKLSGEVSEELWHAPRKIQQRLRTSQGSGFENYVRLVCRIEAWNADAIKPAQMQHNSIYPEI